MTSFFNIIYILIIFFFVLYLDNKGFDKKELTEQTITSNDIDIQADTDHKEPT